VLTYPSAVRGTDGLLHLAYELVVTDTTPFAADVQQLDVRDAKTDRVLLSLSGDALSSRMNPVGGEPVRSTPGSPSLAKLFVSGPGGGDAACTCSPGLCRATFGFSTSTSLTRRRARPPPTERDLLVRLLGALADDGGHRIATGDIDDRDEDEDEPAEERDLRRRGEWQMGLEQERS
jgi:hypothetical protein